MVLWSFGINRILVTYIIATEICTECILGSRCPYCLNIKCIVRYVVLTWSYINNLWPLELSCLCQTSARTHQLFWGYTYCCSWVSLVCQCILYSESGLCGFSLLYSNHDEIIVCLYDSRPHWVYGVFQCSFISMWDVMLCFGVLMPFGIVWRVMWV